MMDTLKTIALFAALAILAGCGANRCDLSALTVKAVELEGDSDGLVTTAVAREIFSRGARSGAEGLKVKGKIVTSPGGFPALTVSAYSEGGPFAGVGSSSHASPTGAASEIAREIARDFCRCGAGGNADAKR